MKPSFTKCKRNCAKKARKRRNRAPKHHELEIREVVLEAIRLDLVRTRDRDRVRLAEVDRNQEIDTTTNNATTARITIDPSIATIIDAVEAEVVVGAERETEIVANTLKQ